MAKTAMIIWTIAMVLAFFRFEAWCL